MHVYCLFLSSSQGKLSDSWIEKKIGDLGYEELIWESLLLYAFVKKLCPCGTKHAIVHFILLPSSQDRHCRSTPAGWSCVQWWVVSPLCDLSFVCSVMRYVCFEIHSHVGRFKNNERTFTWDCLSQRICRNKFILLSMKKVIYFCLLLIFKGLGIKYGKDRK